MTTTQIESSNVTWDDGALLATLNLYDVAGWAHLRADIESIAADDWAVVAMVGGEVIADRIGTLTREERVVITTDEAFKAAVSAEVARLWAVRFEGNYIYQPTEMEWRVPFRDHDASTAMEPDSRSGTGVDTVFWRWTK